VLPYDRWLRSGLGKIIDGTCETRKAISYRPRPESVRRLWQAFLDGAPGLYWSRIWRSTCSFAGVIASGIPLIRAGCAWADPEFICGYNAGSQPMLRSGRYFGHYVILNGRGGSQRPARTMYFSLLL